MEETLLSSDPWEISLGTHPLSPREPVKSHLCPNASRVEGPASQEAAPPTCSLSSEEYSWAPSFANNV